MAVSARGREGAVYRFYLLASLAEHAESVQVSVQLQGGAGCRLPSGAVALSAYSSKEDAFSVAKRMQGEVENVQIVSCVLSGGEALYQSLLCLNSVVERLQHGMVQSAAKSLLKDLADWFVYFADHGSVSHRETLSWLGKELSILASGIVWVGDVRRILCKTIVECSQEHEEIILIE